MLGAWVIGRRRSRARRRFRRSTWPPTPRRSATYYTRYVYFFQAAGLVLLVAMVGAIVLTCATRRA